MHINKIKKIQIHINFFKVLFSEYIEISIEIII